MRDVPSQATAYGAYLTYIDDYLKELGVDSSSVFQSLGFQYPQFTQQEERVPMAVFDELIGMVRNDTSFPDFFLHLGARIPLFAHGNLGAALMACSDVRSMMLLVERYVAILFPEISITARKESSGVVVEYHIATAYSELNIGLLEAILGHTSHNIALITGQPFFPKSLRLKHKKPSYDETYKKYTNCDVEFGAEVNQALYPIEVFDIPILTANAVGQKMLVERCEEELKQTQLNTPLLTHLREIISLYLDQSPSIKFVAEKLRISERTLRRRLNEEGLNYRDVLKDVRHQTALYYLDKTDMRIEQIAWQLGYKETANFRKAFKEISGMSPRQWRDRASA